jgi:hypothetical protein
VFWFVVEPMVLSPMPEVGRFGPFVALPTGLSTIPPEEAGVGDVELLDPEVAALALLAWIGAAFAAGYALLRARDVH